MRLDPPDVSMTWSSQILSYNVRGLAISLSGAGSAQMKGKSGAIYAERGEEERAKRRLEQTRYVIQLKPSGETRVDVGGVVLDTVTPHVKRPRGRDMGRF